MRRLFDTVLVCPPGRNYPNCLSTHPESMTINLELARKQHSEYIRILGSRGIQVETLPPQDTLPDSVFTQDPALIGKETLLLGRSREPSRQPEAEIIARYFGENGRDVMRVDPKANLEGGDILVTEDVVFVGVTGRTNEKGFREVQRCFPDIEVKPVRYTGEFFHLLSVCSYLADDQILLCDRYVDPSSFGGFECLRVSVEDIIAVNVLHLGAGKILMPTGYNRVRSLLGEYGYDPIEIENSEFVKGGGRITCLSSPFYTNLA